MGLIVTLESDPQSLPAALQSGFIMITVNVSRFAHMADLIKQTRTTADLTTVNDTPFLIS